jgi:hypothetical protein
VVRMVQFVVRAAERDPQCSASIEPLR